MLKRPVVLPKVLLLSNRYDYTTDYITSLLYAQDVPFFRLNSDDAPGLDVVLDPVAPELQIIGDSIEVIITPEHLQGVLYRAPTFLRLTTPDADKELLAHQHWVTLFRSLVVFEHATWVNDPNRTFQAESKPYQLYLAARSGFTTPRTIISNSSTLALKRLDETTRLAVKGLDTVLFREAGLEAFGYTESADRGTFAAEDLSALPATVQPWIDDKVDVRVTVVSNEVFAVEVRGPDSSPIRGDWRKIKDGSLRYTPVVLPSDVVQSCLQLTTSLGLCFGAIDLLRLGDRFLFLEINPTGEWAWLVETANLPIDQAMVKLLLSEHA